MKTDKYFVLKLTIQKDPETYPQIYILTLEY